MQFCDPRDNNLFYWYVLCDMRDYPFKYPKYKQNFLFICYFVMYLDFKMFLLKLEQERARASAIQKTVPEVKKANKHRY